MNVESFEADCILYGSALSDVTILCRKGSLWYCTRCLSLNESLEGLCVNEMSSTKIQVNLLEEKVPDLKMFVNLRSESDDRGCDDVSQLRIWISWETWLET